MSHHRRNRVRVVEKPVDAPIWTSLPANKVRNGTPVAKAQNSRLTVTEEAIRTCAYFKWENAGMPPGDGVQFWLEAKQELERTT